jgi:hypothetical protein
MKVRALALPDRRSSGLLLFAAAVVAALSLWLVVAVPAQAKAATVHLKGVQTTLSTDPATTGLLFGAGIIPLPVSPTAVTPTAHAARYTFPITGGAVDATTLAGSIRHSGGILLAHYTTPTTMPTSWQALSLTRFTIRVTAHPFLTAVVNGKARAAIADLDLSTARITHFVRHHHTYVRIAGVGVALNATAVGAINATFGTTLAAPVTLGTATVVARVAG